MSRAALEHNSTLFIKLFKPKLRRRYRVTHRTAHHAELSEISGIVKILRSEDVRDDDVVEARDGFSRVERVRVGRVRSIGSSFRVGGHHGRGRWCGWCCACMARVVVCRFFPEKRFINVFELA